jgi:CHASE2 domain-containing sensor protein
MSAIVVWCLQLFQTSMREFVDTNVQSTLLRSLAEPDNTLQPCSDKNPRTLSRCISVVGIDDSDFRGVFQQQSPLNPDALGQLFDAMRAAPPRVVAIDLDLSPASEQDWPARERLLARLQALSKVTRLVMVCPQGYSTPEPGALDRAWVKRFDDGVEFASADLNVDGLYFNKNQPLKTLGMVSAEAAAETLHPSHHEAEPSQEQGHAAAVDWDARCSASTQDPDAKAKNELIRPTSVDMRSFSQALAQPVAMANRIVLLGGKWGINDQFKLRGQSDGFYGVNLHAWVIATELDPAVELPESAALILELAIGMLAGAAFKGIWAGITHNRDRFAIRSFFYLLFFSMAFGLPLVWVTVAAHLAKFGLVLGAAGMVLSAAADSFLSSHEPLLEPAHQTTEELDVNPSGGIQESGWLHWLQSSARALRIPLGVLMLATVLFFVTWERGHGFWVCLACGVVAGLVLGVLDRLGPGSGEKEKGNHQAKHEVDPECPLDLCLRFIWSLLKGVALYWLLTKSDDHGTSAALVLGFIGFWYLGFRAARPSQPAPRAPASGYRD